ncbi:MAG: PH domain-containing protein [Oscillospiraceae bacterium]|nr:PH domain-containing protein [Oscillospiraceae bacterium]
MIKYKSDKNALTLLIVINILIEICIISLTIYKLYIKKTYSNDYELLMHIAAYALIITYAIFAFVMLPLWFCSLRYFVSSEKIIIQSGVLVKKRIYVRTEAIQYIVVVKCPVVFKVNINIILINVFGNRINLPFLSLHDVEEISKIIQFKLERKNDLC